MRALPSRDDLQRALVVSRCSVDLDTALRSPALALALANTAEALGRPGATRAPSSRSRAPRLDWRARAANDDTDRSEP